jgi:hypothetical protein
MKCWKCESEARGICRFCGRGVCKDHHKLMPFILGMYTRDQGPPRAIVVADVLFCGSCRPQPEPLEMPELR